MTTAQLIRSLAKEPGKMPTILIGEVTGFDASTWLATVTLNAGWSDDDVRVKAVINSEDSGIFIEPVIGSMVLCGIIEGKKESLVVLCWSEIKRTRTIAEMIELNGDSFGGVVKSEVVASEIAELKSELNELKQLLTSWAPVPADGGAALKAVITAWSTAPMTAKPKADYENTKVKHGNG